MEDLKFFLRCPKCKTSSLDFATDYINCLKCNSKFPRKNCTTYLIHDEKSSKDSLKIIKWWDDLCIQWYSSFDKTLTPKKLNEILPELEDSFKKEEHIIYDLDLKSIKNKMVLDIGCGGGAADCIMRSYGAKVFSIDISGERAASTGLKHSLLNIDKKGEGFAAQVNAENIPCCDNSFDIVYSNGVWMHTENYKKLADEAFRVLKPGGKLIIMLYSKYSSQYLIHLLYDGLFKGYIFKYGKKYWLGAATEGKPKFNSQLNPFTKVFSFSQIKELLSQFSNLEMRKKGFTINEIPYFGRRLKNYIRRVSKAKLYHNAGLMRVGKPIYPGYLKIEKILSRFIGWNTIVTADKPKVNIKNE